MSVVKSVSVTEARKDLADIFGEVNYQKQRIILINHNQRVAMVPIEDLEMLETLENEEDIREARFALEEVKKKGSISLLEMKKRLS